MKILSTLILVSVMFIAAGCATAHKMNRLSLGMSKQEVISVMGTPTSTASPGEGQEILRYNLSATADDAYYGITDEYYVRLINGIVDSYGRMGDFDSAKDPTLNININDDD
jgi:hypothetical protein